VRPRLVGRGEELRALRADLRRASDGELRCVLVLGEPGVGKTRLVDELVAGAGGRALALGARAHPLGGTAALGVWIEALEGHLRTLDGTRVRDLCGGSLDDLATVLRSAAAARGGAPEREPPRMRLLEAFAVLLARLAGERPLVVALDDVHLADASSWQGLHYLAGALSQTRLLVVATARRLELRERPDARELLLRLEQEGTLRRLALEPLAAEGVRELAGAALGRASVPEALVEWLAERSRGNPLFALGLLQALVEERADLDRPALRSLPEGLRERVDARLARLDEPELATIELLAVLGRRAELPELELLVARSPERLAELLETLVGASLVREDERGRALTYEIAHPLVQEVVYDRIGGARRRALHRLLGRALLAAGRLGQAAPHFAASADPGDDEAIAVLCDAVREADRGESHAEEVAILEALLELVPSGDRRWLDVLDAMSAHAAWVVEHRADTGADTAIRAMREIERVLDRSGDDAARATAKLRLACFLGWGPGELDEAERSAREALGLFDRVGDAAGVLLVRNELAWLRGMRGDVAGQLAAAEQLVRDAEAVGADHVALQAQGQVGNAATWIGDVARGDAAFARSAELARAVGRGYRHTWSVAFRASSAAHAGRLDDAFALLDEARADPAHRESLALECVADVALLAGRYREAVAAVRESLAWSGGRLPRRRAWAAALASVAASELGDDVEARALAAHAHYATPFLGLEELVAWAEGWLAWHAGDHERGVALADASSAALARAGALRVPLTALDAAELAARAGDATTSAAAARRAAGAAQAIGSPLQDALAELAAGWAALAGDAAARSRGAAAHARAAAEAFARLGGAALEARALQLLGRAGDGEEAIAALERAVAGFAACGAAVRRREALDALAALGAGGRRAAAAAAGPAALTEREREVARLAAGGLTAREIGERLIIGHRTVETHLARAYAKLGVASKVELVRRRAELGL
jgi:DNA-binding CsgD family transcriptional regulator